MIKWLSWLQWFILNVIWNFSKIINTITDNVSNMVKAFKIYGQDSGIGLSEREIEVMYDNGDDGGNVLILTLTKYPESSDEFEEVQLPNQK